jgi:uncharacterized membrane protein
MKKQKVYIGLILLLSVLVGIILPLAIGIKDPLLIVYIFTSVWFIYALVIFVTVFLIRPGLKINPNRRNGVTVVRFELLRKDSE